MVDGYETEKNLCQGRVEDCFGEKGGTLEKTSKYPKKKIIDEIQNF